MEFGIEIKIGIIGNKVNLENVRTVIQDFPNFKPIYFDLELVDDIESGFSRLQEEVEILLFCDYVTCNHYRLSYKFTKPTRYIPTTFSAEIIKNIISSPKYFSQVYSIDTASVDTISSQFPESTEILSSSNLDHINDVLQFHIDNYTNHNAIVITAIESVASKLDELAIPNYLVSLSRHDIINALERSLLAAQTRINNEQQIIIGIIQISNGKQINGFNSINSDFQLLKLQLHKIILDYITSIDGYALSDGSNEFTFVSTRGVFERETRGYKFIPLLAESYSKTGLKLNMGVGFGFSAVEAGKHAQIALSQASEADENLCYIVREDQSVFGPITSSTKTQYEKYQISVTNPKLIEQAEEAGMSVVYMQKLMSRVARFNQTEYTSKDLANALNITLRSANRILLKWTDANLVTIVGEEKTTRQGRPRRLYRLNFISTDDLFDT